MEFTCENCKDTSDFLKVNFGLGYRMPIFQWNHTHFAFVCVHKFCKIFEVVGQV